MLLAKLLSIRGATAVLALVISVVLHATIDRAQEMAIKNGRPQPNLSAAQ